MTEVRVVDPNTGGEKGSKPEKLGAIDPLAILELAKVAGYGTEKYDMFNYLRGYKWSLSYDALQRHALAMWSGQDLDPESGLPHAAHVAWHGLALTSFLLRGLGTDDRFKQTPGSVSTEPLVPTESSAGTVQELLDKLNRVKAEPELFYRPDCLNG